MDVHIVQRGDTLWKISRQYGVSFEDLKRVNAHLANPDYIVPGMKIFIPENKKKAEEQKKPSLNKVQKQETKGEKVKQMESKVPGPEKKPVQPKGEIPVPKEPIPLPSVPRPPTITSKPIEQPAPPKAQKPTEKPVAPVSPEVEQKWETPMPPTPESQHHAPPMPPVQPYPIVGIPCGWFPIYDADCYPHLHPAQMQPMPTPPMNQLPVHEHHHYQPCRPDARPIEREQHPAPSLPKKKQESVKPMPSQPKLQDPMLSVPSKMPDIEESAGKKPPKGALEHPVAPPTHEVPYPHYQEQMQQQYWAHNMHQPYPVHAGHPSPCGCTQLGQMPMWPHPMPSHPQAQPHPFCQSCNQPMFYPMPHHWPGTYS